MTNVPPAGKQRDAEEFSTMQLRVVPRGGSLNVEHVATSTSEQTEHERDLAQLVAAVSRAPGVNLRSLRGTLGGGKDKTDALVADAVREGLIENRGTASHHRYHATDGGQEMVSL